MARIHSPILICYNDTHKQGKVVMLYRLHCVVTTARKRPSYLEMSQLHLLQTAFIWALDRQGKDLSLCKIVRKQLIFQQYFIVNWTLVTCIPKRSRNLRVSSLKRSPWKTDCSSPYEIRHALYFTATPE